MNALQNPSPTPQIDPGAFRANAEGNVLPENAESDCGPQGWEQLTLWDEGGEAGHV